MNWKEQAWANNQQFILNACDKKRLTSSGEVVRFLALAICGEAGELANLVKKEWRGDDINRDKPHRADGLDIDAVRMEMADIRIYLEHLSRYIGIDLDEACREKVEIVTRRLAAKADGPAGGGA